MTQMCTCVPGVVAAGPGQYSVEGGEEVEESPGQDDNIIHHHVKWCHLIAVAQTYFKNSKQIWTLCTWSLNLFKTRVMPDRFEILLALCQMCI